METFFVSYNSHDRAWAEWIGWTLEELGHSVIIQEWDFRPGGNFVLDMQRAIQQSDRTIVVLSPHFLQAKYTQSEWASAFAQDPQTLERKLIPIRVADCKPDGLLKTIAYVDLVGCSQAEATKKLRQMLQDRAKPSQAPAFPGSNVDYDASIAPDFPGDRDAEASRTAPTSTDWVIRQRPSQARRRIERLDGPGRLEANAKGRKRPQTNPPELSLEMVYIPGGTFEMGSPDNEPERFSSEGPQRLVAVPSFLMSRYPITQAQWRFVAALERVERNLKPNPSWFKGDNRPVENVSWYDAVEFCARLSRLTQQEYRLPTEAEWEYACRADTTTPFHFGKTLTPEVANYDGNSTYDNGPKGKNRKETTPVDHFGVANAFGLCDMHGNKPYRKLS